MQKQFLGSWRRWCLEAAEVGRQVSRRWELLILAKTSFNREGAIFCDTLSFCRFLMIRAGLMQEAASGLCWPVTAFSLCLPGILDPHLGKGYTALRLA